MEVLICIPYSRVLCRCTLYSHLRNEYVPVWFLKPFLSKLYRAIGLEQAQQLCEVMPKEYLAQVGVGSINPPSI